MEDPSLLTSSVLDIGLMIAVEITLTRNSVQKKISVNMTGEDVD
jgi:hypothetical protein